MGVNNKVTVCVCTYNKYEILYKCIQSIVKQTAPTDVYDVLIIDNTPNILSRRAGTNHSRVVDLVTQLPNATYIHREDLDGLSECRNHAANICENEFIYYIDDDIILEPSAVECARDYLSTNIDVAVIGGKTLPEYDTEVPSWVTDQLKSCLSVIDYGDDIKPLEKNMWLVGANAVFNVKQLKYFGMFNTQLGRKGNSRSLLSSEETRLISKIRESGKYKIVYNPKLVAHHMIDTTRLTPSWFMKRRGWQAVSDILAHDYYMSGPPHDKQLEQYIKDNIDILLSNDINDTDKKTRLAQLLIYRVLLTGDLNEPD